MNGVNSELTIFAIVIGACIGILYLIICARLMCKLAQHKGYDPQKEHIFIHCLFLGILGWIYTIALPDLHKRESLEKISNLSNKEQK